MIKEDKVPPEVQSLIQELTRQFNFVHSLESKREIARTFAEDLPRVENELMQAIQGRDGATLRSTLHFARGLFSPLENNRGTVLALAISDAIKQSNWLLAEQLAGNLAEFAQNLQVALDLWSQIP